MDSSIAASPGPFRPHDLLWVSEVGALIPVDAWPAWATPEWLGLAPAVVRRAPVPPDGRVPVGLRGTTRRERCAAHAIGSKVVRRITPEDAARRASSRSDLVDSTLPCLRALARLAPGLDALSLAWGVTGSVGFTLASGIDVLREQSDLDLLVRMGGRRDASTLRELVELTGSAGCRTDVQVETLRGAFALAEWVRTGGPVLMKTSLGPVLCDDPWHEFEFSAGAPANA